MGGYLVVVQLQVIVPLDEAQERPLPRGGRVCGRRDKEVLAMSTDDFVGPEQEDVLLLGEERAIDLPAYDERTSEVLGELVALLHQRVLLDANSDEPLRAEPAHESIRAPEGGAVENQAEHILLVLRDDELGGEVDVSPVPLVFVASNPAELVGLQDLLFPVKLRPG